MEETNIEHWGFWNEDLSNTITIDIDPRPAVKTTYKGRFSEKVKEYMRYKEALLWSFKKHGWNVLPPRLKIVFVVKMPDSWPEKKKNEMDGKPHQVKSDIDNYCKPIGDSFGQDDSHLFDLHGTKYWGRSGKIILKKDF